MANSFHITYALYKSECIIANIFRNVVRSLREDFRDDELLGRFIGVRTNRDEGALEGYFKVSFKQSELLDRVLASLMEYRILYKIVYKGSGNVVLWFKHSKICKLCQVVHATSGFTPKTVFVTLLGLIFEFISRDRSKMENYSTPLYQVSRSANEMMGYLLTAREREILYYAYTKGYYSQPRSVTLRQLAVELGLSKSTLNEILRSAERKIVIAYMRHDLPHPIVSKILMRKAV